jgi:hypothetical protein
LVMKVRFVVIVFVSMIAIHRIRDRSLITLILRTHRRRYFIALNGLAVYKEGVTHINYVTSVLFEANSS